MKFEYDPQKSEINKEKHRVTLEEIKQIWLEPAVEIEAMTVDELRIMRIGKLNGKLYSYIYTLREMGIIRLISARRSRKKEEQLYYDHIK